MKRADESAKTSRNLDQLLSKLSEKEILNLNAMSCVKGGDGEGDGGESIIIIPKT
jgi:hypothetical protein